MSSASKKEMLPVTLLRLATKSRVEKMYDDPAACAKVIGLLYVSDDMPGIRRMKNGKGFTYTDVLGKTIKNKTDIKRFRSLVIPPAWTDVWICPHVDGHLQVTGRDIKGRKQYRYHPLWNKMRNMTKYQRMIPFAHLLPRVRTHIQHDLSLSGLPRAKVLAAIVQLLEKTMIRVGNEEYAQKNKSYGLTTFRNRHVEVRGSKIQFTFRGKSGVDHVITCTDGALARIVRACQQMPGQQLFEYVDEDGKCQCISSADVNDYLRGILGDEYTAKDYRTWQGTVLMAMALSKIGPAKTQKEEKKNITLAIKEVSEKLGNTPTVCRNYYIHPGVVAAYQDGSLDVLLKRVESMEKATAGLTSAETAVVKMLADTQQKMLAAIH